MKDYILKFLYCCSLSILLSDTHAQLRSVIDSVSLMNLWETATIKNIDCQLSLKKAQDKNDYYKKILTSGKGFIKVQSQEQGLRRDFVNTLFSQIATAPDLLNDAYIVEHYQSGEGFKATINLYSYGATNKSYIYKLKFGRWELVNTSNLTDSSIKSIFSNINKYLCNDYYTDEMIVVTCIHNEHLLAKALLFPCGEDFKKMRLFISK